MILFRPARDLLLVLGTFLPILSAQDVTGLPLQEGKNLRNSTLLPFPDTPTRKALKNLSKALGKHDWSRAARLLLEISRRPGPFPLVSRGPRWGEGILSYLAGMTGAAPKEFQEELQALCKEEWTDLWKPGLADRGRLTMLVRRFPFLPQTSKAILALAALDLEEGRPREALSVLRRASLLPQWALPENFSQDARAAREAARKVLAHLSSPWPVPEGDPARVPPRVRIRRNLSLRKTLELARPSFFSGPAPGKPPRPRRGWISSRKEWVICGGQVCIHEGTRLRRVDPETLEEAGPPLPLFSLLRIYVPSSAFLGPGGRQASPLPLDLAAWKDRLALVAGPRPKPGDTPGGHALACLRVLPGRPTPRLLWSLRGTLGGPLPPGLPPEDIRAFRKGPLSFAAGPVWIEGDLLAAFHVPLDKTRVSCYLARFDGNTGRVKWVTFLAQGAPEALDPLFDRLAAMPFPGVRGAPLCLVEGEVICATGLGTVQAVDAWDGRRLWAFRTSRTRPQVNKERGFLRSAVMEDQDRILACLEDSDWIYLFRPFPRPGGRPLLAPPLPRGNLCLSVGLRGGKAYFLSAQEGEYSLCRITLPSGRIYAAPPLQSGEHFLGRPLLAGRAVLFCTEEALYRADTKRDLYLEIEYPVPPGQSALMGTLLPWKGGLLSLGRMALGAWR